MIYGDLNLDYTGSFQLGTVIRCESPIEEVWDQIARYSSREFLKQFSGSTDKNLIWDEFIDYGAVRIQQAVEFRQAARESSLLTAPLPLYYSILNLTRAFLALKNEIKPTSHHGLIFKKGEDLLSCNAVLVPGTFTEYLEKQGVKANPKLPVSLNDCFSRIIEIFLDYSSLGVGEPLCFPVKVKCLPSGPINLIFNSINFSGNLSEGKFKENWKSYFPKLAACCEILLPECTLFDPETSPSRGYENIAKWCYSKLEVCLTYSDEPIWYTIREPNKELVFPRAGYYFVAMFILGNIVRYEPEILLAEVRSNSKLGWFLKRFLRTTERFYPQLILNWWSDGHLFFSQ